MRGVPWNEYADGVLHCAEHALHSGESPDEHLRRHWDLPSGSAVRCSDLWDFYTRIGYDWKAKKYLRPD